MSLAQDANEFDLRRGAWKIEQCAICEWDLFESKNQPENGVARTNGRDWVCMECYEKFLDGPDYFAGADPQIK